MKCIETYDGKEFWVDDERAEKIQKERSLVNPPKNFIVDGNDIANNNIAGIFSRDQMREKEFRKQGMFTCEYMRWHNFKEACHCKENFMKYGEFGTAPKSKQCIEFEKQHGALELNLDENYKPKTLVGDLLVIKKI